MKVIAVTMSLALIGVAVGLVGWRGVNTLRGFYTEIAQKLSPGTEALLSLSEAQREIQALERTLLSSQLDEQARSKLYAALDQAWSRAQAARQEYESLPHTAEEQAQWSRFLEAWDQWKADHEKILALSKQLDATTILDPMGLKYTLMTLENGLNMWMNRLSAAIINTEALTTDLAAEESPLGRWIAAADKDNAELKAILDGMRADLDTLYASAGEVNKAVEMFDTGGAQQLFAEKCKPQQERILEWFQKIHAIADKARTIYDAMVQHSLTKASAAYEAARGQLLEIQQRNAAVRQDFKRPGRRRGQPGRVALHGGGHRGFPPFRPGRRLVEHVPGAASGQGAGFRPEDGQGRSDRPGVRQRTG